MTDWLLEQVQLSLSGNSHHLAQTEGHNSFLLKIEDFEWKTSLKAEFFIIPRGKIALYLDEILWGVWNQYWEEEKGDAEQGQGHGKQWIISKLR